MWKSCTVFGFYMKIVHSGVDLMCHKCKFTTKNLSFLNKHLEIVHTESIKQSCQLCGKVVKNQPCAEKMWLTKNWFYVQHVKNNV